LASEDKKFLTGYIGDVVFAQHSVPQALTVVAKRTRRVITSASGFNDF
jgi:hypothetical protein